MKLKVKIGNYKKRTERSVDVEIEDFDTWGLDHTLALIILPALIQLKETKHGVPAEFADVGGEDYVPQDSFDFYKETNTWAFDKSCAKWDEILDKMIWSFDQIVKDDHDSLYHHGKSDIEFVESDQTYTDPFTGKVEKTYEMINKNKNSWYDHVGHQLHEEKIREGLELFGKYYRALWD